jgi:hypothetical protein
MHVYVQKSTSTTLPPTSSAVSGGELSQPVAIVEPGQAAFGGQRGRPRMSASGEPAHAAPIFEPLIALRPPGQAA